MSCAFGDCQRTTEGPGMVQIFGRWQCYLCRVIARLPQPTFRQTDDRRDGKKSKRDTTDDLL